MKKVPTREAADRTLQEREEAEESWERFQKTADSQKLRQEHASKSSVKSKADKERLPRNSAQAVRVMQAPPGQWDQLQRATYSRALWLCASDSGESARGKLVHILPFLGRHSLPRT